MSIGVLLFATAGDRLKGDPGYPGTFEFPVEYGIVEGSYRDLIEGSPDACRRLCEAAKKLAKKNVSAIAGDCGLMALYQRQIADSAGIPVISSSLLFLPFARMMIPTGTVGWNSDRPLGSSRRTSSEGGRRRESGWDYNLWYAE